MKHHCDRGGTAGQLILGLAVMLLGLLLVLENFGLLRARLLIQLWPLLLVGAGVMRLYYSLRSGARPAGLVLVGLGLGQLLVNFGLISFRQALAVFLLVTGAVIAARAVRRSHRDEPALPVGPVVDLEGRHLDLFAFMSYISRAASGEDFRGGQVTAVMGACEIDLRGARIDGEAVINIFAFWGGIEMKVPSDWVVEGRGMAVLGAFEDNTRRADDSRQKLIVTGMVIMGGVEVKN